MSGPVYAGIDVSKKWLDVAFSAGHAPLRVLNTQEGHESLVTLLATLNPVLIVMEATGSYERMLVTALLEARLPAAVVNPLQVRNFAKATGRLAKTDSIDAAVLAHFAEAIKPDVTVQNEPDLQALGEIVIRRRQLVVMRDAEADRLRRMLDPVVRKSTLETHEFLQKMIKELDEEIDGIIRRSPAWREKVELLKSVKGVGDQTARVLIAQLPELGRLSRQKIGALAGLAPMNNDSGMFRGKRHIRGGRLGVRCALYMASLSAITYNATIRSFYLRLVESGKPKKVALIAAARKLLTILNAIIRTNSPWKSAHEA